MPAGKQLGFARARPVPDSHHTICSTPRSLCGEPQNYLNSITQDQSPAMTSRDSGAVVFFAEDGRINTTCYDGRLRADQNESYSMTGPALMLTGSSASSGGAGPGVDRSST